MPRLTSFLLYFFSFTFVIFFTCCEDGDIELGGDINIYDDLCQGAERDSSNQYILVYPPGSGYYDVENNFHIPIVDTLLVPELDHKLVKYCPCGNIALMEFDDALNPEIERSKARTRLGQSGDPSKIYKSTSLVDIPYDINTSVSPTGPMNLTALEQQINIPVGQNMKKAVMAIFDTHFSEEQLGAYIWNTGHLDFPNGIDFVEHDNNTFSLDNADHSTYVASKIKDEITDRDSSIQVFFIPIIVNSSFDFACGLYYLRELIDNYGLELDAINASIGWYLGDNDFENDIEADFFKTLLADFKNDSIPLFASAGNCGRNTDLTIHFPSGLSYYRNEVNPDDDLLEVWSIAASDGNMKADFSNYGSSRCDFAAPGVNISTLSANGNVTQIDGTSIACPYVLAKYILERKSLNNSHQLSIIKLIQLGKDKPLSDVKYGIIE